MPGLPTILPQLPERYLATRLLGEGATGVVYHAEDRLLDSEVAVKVVKPNLALHRRFRARFAREVAISARIVHPHVIPVVDTGVLSSGEPWVALGYAVGGNLGELLRVRPALAEVLRLMDEVLDALAAVHARLMLHQDLKPGNILLHAGTDGQVHAWVADLGVADALAELNRDRKVISGTPGYMAPEQLLGRTHDLGPWTDLYAVGLMLYETLTGQRPHAGEGRQELLEARMHPAERIPVSDDVPLALSDLVAALLDPEPRQRFDRAADVRRALRDAVQGLSFRGRVRAIPASLQAGASTGPVLETGEYPLSSPEPAGPRPEGAPRWNRVAPDPISANPPPERGWEAASRLSLPIFALREVPLVGRERERKVIWDAAREVVALSEPRVVLIVGDAGSGRSRLTRSISLALEETGWMEVVRLRYRSPASVDDGYRGAVRDILVPWNDNRDGAERRLASWIARDRKLPPSAVHEEASVLARWCGFLREGEPPVSDAVALAFLYRHLDARSWRGGSCLILEDVHHAHAAGDGLSIAEALLDRTVGERAVLAVCTVSAEAIAGDPALGRKVESLQERGARRIGLRKLNLTETRKVVQESLALEPELARLVSMEYEGDPRGAGLLLREWASRKLLVLNDRGQYTLRPDVTPAEALPPSRESLVIRRLNAALEHSTDPVAAREALAVCLFAGPDPPVALVRAVNDAGVDALLATGLVTEELGSLVIESSEVHRAATAQLDQVANPQEVHRRIADAWQELGATSGLDVDLPLGLHRHRAGDSTAAVVPLLQAVFRMNRGGRARDAIPAAAEAIEAADAAGSPTARLEARRAHAQALVESHQLERGLSLIDHALATIDGDRLARARLRVLRARTARKLGDIEAANKELDIAYATFEGLRDRSGLLEVAGQRARLARAEGRHSRALAHWGEMLRLNRGDPGLEAEALNGLVEAMLEAGQLDHIDKQVDRLQRVSRLSGDTRRIAEATTTWGMLHMARGETERARRQLETAAAISATLGAARLQLRCRLMLADLEQRAGNVDTAEEIARWAARFAEERGNPGAKAQACVRLAFLALERSDTPRVAAEVEAAEVALRDSPRHSLWLHVGLLRAALAAEEGDERGCRAWWSVARERGIEQRASSELRPALTWLCERAAARHWSDVASRAAAVAARATTALGPMRSPLARSRA
ncbi:MAG: serine/threonine-protein kinase PknK [Myxococcales bacterium]|nr:serine/threonine-protein kinase PknK [Myxococcales bacterium]